MGETTPTLRSSQVHSSNLKPKSPPNRGLYSFMAQRTRQERDVAATLGISVRDLAELTGVRNHFVTRYGRVARIAEFKVETLPTHIVNGRANVFLQPLGRQFPLAVLVGMHFCDTFLPSLRKPGDHVIHLDGDLTNCASDNLVWHTSQTAAKRIQSRLWKQ